MELFTMGKKEAGRPAGRRLEKEDACYDLLDRLGVAYSRVDHDAADTIAQCHAVETVLGAPVCKNLFLCNRQKTQFYLLLLAGDKVFHTKDLSRQLGCARLSFAGPEDMAAYLNVTPGSVSVLGLLFDRENRVQLVIDRPVTEQAAIGCHPCINTSTLSFSVKDLLESVLPALGHAPVMVALPEDEE